MTRYEPVIGLEVHAQLSTRTKLFCSCRAQYGGEPNTKICPTCAGLPGALPTLNEQAVRYAVMTAKALRCTLHERSLFARKNYFYPDLPKGYQISQYELPLATNGSIDVDYEDGTRTTAIRRVHIEEDAGKLIHTEDNLTLVDLNRCGVPLLEIVSEPELRSPAEASRYLQRLRQILLYLGVSDGNMEEGSLRCDANISVRPTGQKGLSERTELKNLNSFRFLEKALTREIERQCILLEAGSPVYRETLLWDEENKEVSVMRLKEEEQEYRYFPEPDLTPLYLDPSTVRKVTERLCELPLVRKKRLADQYDIPERDAEILTRYRELADYFEEVVGCGAPARRAGDWIKTRVLAILPKHGRTLPEFPVPPRSLASLLNLIENGWINVHIARRVFEIMREGGGEPLEIVDREGLARLSDRIKLNEVVEEVICEFTVLVERYHAGKIAVLDRLMGEVMKRTEGRADPEIVREILLGKLDVPV